MEFSLLLTSTDADSGPRQFQRHIRMTQLAEQYGFSTIVASHHFLSHPYAYFQPLALLSRLSGETSLKLATGVLLLPMLNPVEVAESFATLDVVSNGRATFGVGIGYRPSEFANLGVAKGERGARFEESLRLIEKLWTADDPVDFDGTYFQLQNAQMTMKPLQKPTPPIWIAGMTDKAVRRAAEFGYAWYINPNASISTIETQMDLYRTTLQTAQNPVPAVIPVRREVYISTSGDHARERARKLVANRYTVYGEWDIRSNLPPSEQRAHDSARKATALPGDGRFIVGDVNECAETLVAVEQAVGTATEFVFRVQWPGISDDEIDNTIRLLGAEVLPRVRELTTAK